MNPPGLNQADYLKMKINVGAGFDIPTGNFVQGVHGEHILNGGLGVLDAAVGFGNCGKTMIEEFRMYTAQERLCHAGTAYSLSRDTEFNKDEARISGLVYKAFPKLTELDAFNAGIIQISDITAGSNNDWFQAQKDWITAEKIKAKNLTKYQLPYLDRNGKDLMTTIMPSFGFIDSVSEFSSEAVQAIRDDNELGESGMNIINMRQGLERSMMLQELPYLAGCGRHFYLLTAHFGKDNDVKKAGAMTLPPVKALANLPPGFKIKGVSEKFFFLLHNCWLMGQPKILFNDTDKAAQYPKTNKEMHRVPGDKDLQLYKATQLRGKAGSTGYSLDIASSQEDGILPSLTEYINIKEGYGLKSSAYFGITGTSNFVLDICPDIKLQRTTLREKIDSSQPLRRALNITSELMQMWQYMRYYDDLLCTPKELFDDIKALGYDWDEILGNTRGWYTLNNDKVPGPKFLSTLDLLRMRKNLYKPFWK